MLIIGLTGGIGSGKSTVAERFIDLGIPVIDADQLARELVAPNQPALQEIIQTFGPQIVTPTGDLAGYLDRPALRQRIFSSDTDRKNLETILHPRIITAIQNWLQNLKSVPYAVLMAPLLLEAKLGYLCNRILVVDLPESLQIERACKRDGYNTGAISAIMHNQWSRSKRLAAADDILDNSGDKEFILTQIDILHKQYIGQQQFAMC